MRNLGKDVFSVEVGKQGLNDLFKTYAVDSLNDLQSALSNVNKDAEIDLYKKIDISRLSKGERQIFILSLYWAIIEYRMMTLILRLTRQKTHYCHQGRTKLSRVPKWQFFLSRCN